MKTVYTNTRIYTGNPEMPWAQQMVIDNGRIEYIGPQINFAYVSKRIDCGGHMIIPKTNTVNDVLGFIRENRTPHDNEEAHFLIDHISGPLKPGDPADFIIVKVE